MPLHLLQRVRAPRGSQNTAAASKEREKEYQTTTFMSCSKTCTIPVNESKLGVAAVKEGDTGGSSKQVLNAASAKARKQPNFAATVRSHSLLRNL